MARILEIKNEDAYWAAVEFVLGGSQENKGFSEAIEANDLEWVDDFSKTLKACMLKRQKLKDKSSVEAQNAKLATFIAMQNVKRLRFKEELKKLKNSELIEMERAGKKTFDVVRRPLKPYEIEKKLEEQHKEFAAQLRKCGGSERVVEKRIIRNGTSSSKYFLPAYKIKN